MTASKRSTLPVTIELRRCSYAVIEHGGVDVE
jgi:hypothetical protein